MSIEAIGAVMRCAPIFEPGHKAVLFALVNFVDENGCCYPSVPEIAWLTGMSQRNVRRIILDLEDLGLILIAEKGGGRRANRYQVALDWLDKAELAIVNAKKKALQEGADRYKEMGIVAKAWRDHLYQEMHNDPVRGPRWRDRHKRTATSKLKTVEKGTATGVTPDTVSGVRGDAMSGVEPEKKFGDVPYVTPALTNEAPALTPCQVSPDASVTLSVIDPLNNPSVETPPSGEVENNSDGDPPSKGCRLEEGRGEGEASHHPPIPTYVEIRKADEAVRSLADALGMPHYAIAIRMGSLTAAAELARAWSDGEIALDQVRLNLAELESEAA